MSANFLTPFNTPDAGSIIIQRMLTDVPDLRDSFGVQLNRILEKGEPADVQVSRMLDLVEQLESQGATLPASLQSLLERSA
jgi:hypothetical protein